MNNYEITLVATTSMTETDAQNLVAKVASLIAKTEGRIYTQGFWGKQRLAYPIGRHEYGYYATMIFTYPPDQISNFNHEIQLMPDVIRHLIISLNKENIRPEDMKLIDPFKEQLTPTRSAARPTATTRRAPATKPATPQKDEATRMKELDEKLGNLLKEE
ncbi:MAG: 30S ribosomal protein S6, small subunit ribosomal protein S6 [candidate division Kazan bacterium GW2011_GWA1_50_15]|uniref:Small ribosomal subunit protein bS6 n=2 Tax=Bacteria division Kazan-3B-28 TaxID=1798534 RepID=A0A0G1X8C2_UNCK3|nr:MAG: 30S ribosomal protein S6, small subunit ribosomal protein S6 [candidate division Kazan bacterium GW2011_GWA1_50_15]KKW25719.1 MAG: 30S ribosomal protein S6 [candidate division Kazan bacterium GW2011_GWC1_52_13]KKW27266.1 MAG: 30S ribosomal protein S6 [candidate division Kazan bacterium GW2011_GWB1_52_7]HAV65992.1 30S ribosomal protein S6 [Patescibacteria group bacterium]HCR42560.1 30S ribosomal protein S6 [Patescibacteria group bacterium]